MFISVIIASYNYGNYIKEVIESVISQTYDNWELIIVDDGSSDNSCEIIKEYTEKDNRIKLFTHPDNENKGLVETLKLGVSVANGDWIAFLESDDLWRESCLEKRVSALKNNPDTGLIFNTVELFGSNDKVLKMQKVVNSNEKYLSGKSFPSYMFEDFAIDNHILTFSSVMVKKAVLKFEYFNSPVDKLFDWWLYIHLAKGNKFFRLNEPLTLWRVHDNSYINKKSGKPHIIQMEAYFDVLKNDFSLKLLLTYISLFIKLLFSLKFLKNLKAYFARKLKSLAGININ